MSAVTYPATLPAPSLWGGQPFDRAARSPLPGNTQLRGRSRDAMQDIDAAWVYTAAEMAAWVAWYDDTLLRGMRWFAMAGPGAGGWIDRVLKFRTNSLRREPLGNGNFRVSAKVQQRGISAAPRACWYERFSAGLGVYSNVGGVGAARFAIVASPYGGSSLRYIGGTDVIDNAIERSVPNAVTRTVALNFLVESASADNSATVYVFDAGGVVFTFRPREDSFADASQRAYLSLSGSAAYLGSSAAALNVWHRVTASFNGGAYTVRRLDTGVVVASGTLAPPGSAYTATALRFTEDSDTGSTATQFALIELCP